MTSVFTALRRWGAPAGAVALAMVAGTIPLPAQDTGCDSGCVGAVEAALEWAAADLDRLAVELQMQVDDPVILAAADRTDARRAGSLDAVTLRSIAGQTSARWRTDSEAIDAYLQAKSACSDDPSTAHCRQSAGRSAVGVWRVRPVSSGAYNVEAWVEVITPRDGEISSAHGRGATLEVKRQGGEWVVSDVVLRIVSQD